MVKKEYDVSNALGEEIFGGGLSTDFIETDLRWDIFYLRIFWSLSEAKIRNDLAAYSRVLSNLEIFMSPLIPESYAEELKLLNEEYKNRHARIRPDKRESAEPALLNELLDNKARILLKHAKEMGLYPKKILWD